MEPVFENEKSFLESFIYTETKNGKTIEEIIQTLPELFAKKICDSYYDGRTDFQQEFTRYASGLVKNRQEIPLYLQDFIISLKKTLNKINFNLD